MGTSPQTRAVFPHHSVPPRRKSVRGGAHAMGGCVEESHVRIYVAQLSALGQESSLVHTPRMAGALC